MTDEQKEILDIKFPKELPKGHTEAEKLKAAQWEIARLKKRISELRENDIVRRKLWRDVLVHNSKLGQKLSLSASDADKALKHYDKTFYGH